ncbi:hypothetical protein C0J52_10498 [Blattella germanica]|nr:hypothetical protein C0J52_10498 [Blattella germanica]
MVGPSAITVSKTCAVAITKSSCVSETTSITKTWGYSNGGSNSCNWGSIASDGGGITSHGSSDGYRSSNSGYWGGVSSYGSGDLSDGGSKRSLVDDSVESVDGVSGVFDSADGTVGFHKAVASLDNIAVTALVLALGITGKSVLDVVSEAVLGMRVEVGVDGYLSDGGGGIGDGSYQRVSLEYIIGEIIRQLYILS